MYLRTRSEFFYLNNKKIIIEFLLIERTPKSAQCINLGEKHNFDVIETTIYY